MEKEREVNIWRRKIFGQWRRRKRGKIFKEGKHFVCGGDEEQRRRKETGWNQEKEENIWPMEEMKN